MKTIARFAPLVLSAFALALVLEGVLEFGHHPPADEEWHAHLFQIAAVLELPVLIAFIATTWRSWKQNVSIFATHAALWIAAFATLRVMHY